ncbi:MAG: hypothetical protein QE280_06945 [Caulobacter sp.]|nr:hypothetical protein [Caulobacter sp.]
MRVVWFILICLVLAGPVLSGPVLAQAQQAAPSAASAGQAGLRGSTSPVPGALRSPRSRGPAAGLAFTRPLASTASAGAEGRTASQCRTRCAQSYYFCLAASDNISCNGRWARCTAGCS